MPTIIPALPSQPTVQPITQILTVPNSGHTVVSGTTVYATSLRMLFQSGDSNWVSSLTNAGTLWVESSQDNGWGWSGISSDVRGNVANSGTMVVHAGPATSMNVEGVSESDLNNSGNIYVINEGSSNVAAGTGDATGVGGFTSDSVVNSGLIAVQALHGSAYGILFYNGGSFNNQSGGQLLVEGASAIALYSGFGGAPNSPETINNAGTIRAAALDPELYSIGLYLSGIGQQSLPHTYNVTNSGVISADVAIFGADDSATTMGIVVQQIYNLAGGQINGLVYLQRGNDIVENAGTINGDVYMGEGADTVDTRNGTINGISDLGWGSDTYKGGSGTDLVAGGRDNDNLEGGAGDDQLMGGGGDDLITGGAGNDGLFGETGNDRIVTAAGDYVDSGDGNDRIELGDYTFETVSGGAGFDTLVLPGGARSINLATVLSQGGIAEIEQIELGGNKTITIGAADVAATTGGETTLRLETSATDQVNLVGDWIKSVEVIGTTIWDAYLFWTPSGTTRVLVHGGATVSINAASNVGGGLDPVPGSPALIPGYSDLDYTPTVEIVDDYELTAPVTIQSYETIRAGETGVVFGDWLGNSINNYGTIESVGRWAFTLRVPNIDAVVNYGTIRAVATESGYSAYAIYTDSFSDIRNHGLITVSATVGDATGVDTYDLTNTGTIEVRTTTGFALGVSTWNGHSFNNSGQITVTSGGIYSGSVGQAATGVSLYNHDVAFNSGTISATADVGGALGLSAFVYDTTTVTNSGTISAISRAPDSFPDSPDAVAIYAHAYYSTSLFSLVNSGQITGELIFGGLGTGNVSNSGVINGPTHFSDGADIFNGTAGTQGEIWGGGGSDWITGGASSDNFHGDDGNDTLRGNEGEDFLSGGSGNDIVEGGGGSDLLNGGAGADVFYDRVDDHDGDTIVDFAAGDSIVFVNASLSNFTFSLTGNSLQFTGGGLTLANAPAGRLVATAAAGGGVQLALATADAANDFNGDGRSDILWRNVNSGEVVNWLGQANGSFVGNSASFNNASLAWNVAGTGDFNGDGRDDILWRNANSGEVVDWLGQANGSFAGNGASLNNASNFWHIAGIGDFNGDGRDDILWRSNDGQITNWLGQANGSFAGNANALNSVSSDWQAQSPDTLWM